MTIRNKDVGIISFCTPTCPMQKLYMFPNILMFKASQVCVNSHLSRHFRRFQKTYFWRYCLQNPTPLAFIRLFQTASITFCSCGLTGNQLGDPIMKRLKELGLTHGVPKIHEERHSNELSNVKSKFFTYRRHRAMLFASLLKQRSPHYDQGLP